MATNLQFINKTEVTSGVTTVNVDNVFTDQYDVYMVQITGLHQNSNVANDVEGIRLIDNSGSVVTGSEYAYALLILYSGTTFSEQKSTSDTRLRLGLLTDQLSDGQTGGTFYVYNPNDSSSYTFINSQTFGFNSSDNNAGGKMIGVHKTAETIRGFQLYESNGARPFGGGQITVYGVK